MGPMKAITAAAAPALLAAACAHAGPRDAQAPAGTPTPLADVVVAADPDLPRPPFDFAPDDAALLDEIQRGAFNTLWDQASATTGMAFDRTLSDAISLGGVGFQLSALPVAAERGWVTRGQAEARALRILRAIDGEPSNRKAGLYYHFVHPETARPGVGYETVVSTVDSALLLAGMLTASSYFGGEVARIADRLVADADWSFFVAPPSAPEEYRGFISLAWTPSDPDDPTGDGGLSPHYWIDSGDEHLLVTFLAVAAPDPGRRVPPETYYRLRRRLGAHGEIGPFVWFPWSGALFTNVFAHCWLDYAAMGPDDPASLGVAPRPRVDWWANARHAALMHRAKCVENPEGLEGLGPDAWGLTACDSPEGYLVPGLFPTDLPMPGGTPGVDFSVHVPEDEFGGGTIAPYGAGMATLFLPGASLEALRNYRDLARRPELLDLWQPPDAGGQGFADSFNLGKGWVSPERFAIDQGSMLLAIENARTGLVWELFHAHRYVREAMGRLNLTRTREGGDRPSDGG
jgi:hypothetical protein